MSKNGKVDGYIGEVEQRQEWQVIARGEGEEGAPKSENGNYRTPAPNYLSTSKVKNAWTYTSTTPFAFIV
jgi:hypothetical protein